LIRAISPRPGLDALVGGDYLIEKPAAPGTP
jgi:hypothetical protein